jgi:hypothetical protein
MPYKKPNHTPTGRYFAKTKPFDRKLAPSPSRPAPPGMQRISRLGFNGLFLGKQEWSCYDLARTLEQRTFGNTIFFPDTGFFTTAMVPRVWDSLCSRTVALVPGVLGELQGWLADPYQNQEFAAVVRKAIEMQGNPPNQGAAKVRWGCRDYLDSLEWQPYAFGLFSGADRFGSFAFHHYRDLLLVRKLVGAKVAGDLKTVLGRDPTDEEVRVAVRKRVGLRGERIAFKGWKDYSKRNYSTDEELVVTAVLTAIVTGRETLILTWDTDLQEQFVKLMMLLASDYYAYLFAEYAASNRETIPWRHLPVPSGVHGALRTTSNVFQCVCCPTDFVESLRPEPYHQVNCYCYVLGNSRHDLKLTPTVFSAEREMSCMLQVKARSGGRNTDKFGTLNIHGGSIMKDGRQYRLFALFNDSYTDFMGVRVASLDLEHALMTKELIDKRYV